MSPKTTTLSILLALLCSAFSRTSTQAQTFSTVASAVWLSDCNQSNFFNTSGSGPDLIGPAGNVFTGANLGAYTQNSGALILRGAEIRTAKDAVANVCSARMHYRIYLQTGVPGSFTTIELPLSDNCDIPSGQFASGGACGAGDQKWSRVIADEIATPYAPINLTSFAPGNYVLEVYYDLAGSSTTTTQCDDTITLDNGGTNYKTFFSIQAPALASNNPTTCNGTEGSITISGLVPGLSYTVNYTDDGVPAGPINLASNASGQVIISGLNAGVYSNLELLINGCTTEFFTGIILSNPLFTPTFTKIASFCAGSIQPILPPVSNNGISGSWSPSTVNNQSSGSYIFTPTAGQCGLPATMNVTVIPRTIPTFSFGTSLTICEGAAVPALPTVSLNGINGTWSPAVVSNLASGVYTFTPAAGLCATSASFTVTVTPNIIPVFDFGTALSVCAGQPVPALPAISTNGIAGSWSPSVIDDQHTGIYTFTPNAGLCATTATFTVTVNPIVTPTFSFGTSLTICGDGTVPALPAASTEGITGVWNPSTVDNQNSGNYTFTPDAGFCATPVSFTVTVNPNIIPTFSFGTSLTICEGGTVTALPTTSVNGITGVWNPSIVDNQHSGVYTFTPDAGLCAVPTNFSVTVNPNIIPAFNFGTTLTICEGAAVPALPATSTNGITGTWSPSSVDNQNSGVYTFTPTAGLCAIPTNFTVTVNLNVTPIFSFGTSLTICDGGIVPVLPASSTQGIAGTWNPALVSNQTSGVYTFTPDAGLCATPVVFTVNITPNITPAFSIGTALAICAGGTVPALPSSSTNAITGVWNPAIVDNQSSGVYTFTPDPGLCATTATFSVTVNPNITPVFGFGTSLTICGSGTVPLLPAASMQGITGSWSPAIVSNQNSGVYTFTPDPGLCATTATFTVTVNPNITPTFSFGTSLTICGGGTVPALTAVSTQGITGTWSPAVVSDQSSGVYTFTPDAGLCATTATFTVTVNANITPVFNFGTSLTICKGGSVPALPSPSTNAITGVWNPAVVDNQSSAVYTFTPDAGLCATTAIFTVTVNPNITPTFDFGTSSTICANAAVPALPAVSIEGIAGTWSPSAVDNQNSGIYTFTPASGLCATTTTFTLTVNPNVTPSFSFGTSLTICAGGTVPILTSTSTEGITGVWNPSIVDDQVSGSYTFTPAAGLCATTTTFVVTVNPNITPSFSFGTSSVICTEATVPALPTPSLNNIEGSWSPSVISNQVSDTYTFTPNTGLCAVPATFTVTVNPNILPVFSFGTSLTICAGGSVPALPALSTNGIAGTWNPSVVDNQASAVYTFIPAAGECATITTFTLTVDPNIVPAFNFGSSLTICAGGAVPVLPATSTNGINGVWNPAIASNLSSGTYTFTPASGLCATTTSFTITVNPNITPSFDFGVSLSACNGATMPALPLISANGINGTWSPASIDNLNSGTYTFTPASGECATTTQLAVTINPIVTPAFDFGSTLTICSGAAVPALPAISTNGIHGDWNPAVISNQASGVYTFTPAVGECAIPTTFTVTVTPTVTPVFSFGTTLVMCAGTTAPVLPAVSANGIAGVWSPAIVSNLASGTYTFSPTATPEQCIATTSFTVTVKQIETPSFSFGTSLTICAGSTVPLLPASSANSISGTWSPATINNQVSGTYKFTSAPNQCAATSVVLTVNVNPVGTVNASSDTIVNDGAIIPANNFSGTPGGVIYTWSNSNPAIGLPASGTGGVPVFTATNRGNDPITSTITVTPTMNGCPGTARSYIVTVKPLNKDVFIPNVFSPNGDGKNDMLFVYGNYIDKLDMRIFNQWGEQVITINNSASGWDGTYRGKAQPVGVYVYTLQATMTDGRKVKLKGSITLLR